MKLVVMNITYLHMEMQVSVISMRCGGVARHTYTIARTRLMSKAGAALCSVAARVDTRMDTTSAPASVVVVCIVSKLSSCWMLSTLQADISCLSRRLIL